MIVCPDPSEHSATRPVPGQQPLEAVQHWRCPSSMTLESNSRPRRSLVMDKTPGYHFDRGGPSHAARCLRPKARRSAPPPPEGRCRRRHRRGAASAAKPGRDLAPRGRHRRRHGRGGLCMAARRRVRRPAVRGARLAGRQRAHGAALARRPDPCRRPRRPVFPPRALPHLRAVARATGPLAGGHGRSARIRRVNHAGRTQREPAALRLAGAAGPHLAAVRRLEPPGGDRRSRPPSTPRAGASRSALRGCCRWPNGSPPCRSRQHRATP